MNVEKKVKLNKIFFGASAALALIIYTVSALMRNCLSPEVLPAVAAVSAVHNIVTAFNKTKDRRTSIVYGIIGFIEVFISLFCLVYVILQRCEVL